MATEQLQGLSAKISGRHAASLKYDVLTALGAHGCAGDKHLQRLVLRFITLIVARYNWQAGELSCGQREIASLWSVDERTVKRDMAKLRDLGWLQVKRAAARGRVAVLALSIPDILGTTQTDWTKVGPDFTARMSKDDTPETPAVSPRGNVVSFPVPSFSDTLGLWGEVCKTLHAEMPELYAAWFAGVSAQGLADGRWRISAPSKFHANFLATHHATRLERLMRRLDPSVTGVEFAVA